MAEKIPGLEKKKMSLSMQDFSRMAREYGLRKVLGIFLMVGGVQAVFDQATAYADATGDKDAAALVADPKAFVDAARQDAEDKMKSGFLGNIDVELSRETRGTRDIKVEPAPGPSQEEYVENLRGTKTASSKGTKK